MPAAGKTNTVRLSKGDRILVVPSETRPGYARESQHKRKGNPVALVVNHVRPVQVPRSGGRVANRYEIVGDTDDGRRLVVPNVAGGQTYILA